MNRLAPIVLILCALSLAVESPVRNFYIPIKGSAWRLALGDLNGDGKQELIYGTYKGALRAIRSDTARLLWEVPLDGFPFAVAARDIDGDGQAEAFAATAGGSVYAVSPRGRILWRFRSEWHRALYNVAVGRCGAGKLFVATGGMDRTVTLLSPAGDVLTRHGVDVVAGRMTVADFDADGSDEIFVVDRRYEGELLKYEDKTIKRIWRKALHVPERMRNWENPSGYFYAFSVEAGDLNGDGAPELVMGDTFFNKQPVMAIDARGERLWLSPILPRQMSNSKEIYSRNTWYEFYSTARVGVGEVREDSPGPEVVCVTGGNLRIFSSKGQLLGTAEAPVGFTDLALDGKTLYLGSSPNGDDTIYKISLEGDYPHAFGELRRHGLAKEMGETLADLRSRVMNYRPARPSADQQYSVMMFRLGRTERAVRETAAEMHWFHSKFPYGNLRPVASLKVIESSPPLGPDGKPWNPRRWQTDSINGTMTVEQIVEAARLIEQHQIPTLFNIGHSCTPFITLATAEKMLQAAPHYLVGFLSAEDEDFRAFPRYAKYFLGPLADLCRKYGNKKCLTKNKNVWWMSVPSIPEVFHNLFDGGRGSVLAGYTEDSNSRTPEINLLARLGLRQAGLLEGLQASAIGDLFSFSRFHEWEYPKHGHPYLRLYVAHTLLGANSYEYRPAGLFAENGSLQLTRMAQESIELFLHMLGKHLVFTPSPDQQAGLSPVGIAVHQPPEKWFEDAHNGHHPEIWKFDRELEAAVFPHNGCLWGNTPTPEHALQHVLLRKERQFGYQVPPTPYGVFAIVPAEADLSKVVGVKEWWHTDGIYVWREDGWKLSGMEAARALRSSFEQAAARLPFRAEGDDVFFHSLKMREGAYRLYAIDPGWLDPGDRNIKIKVQLPGRFRISDALSGEQLTPSNPISIRVPAGALRILDAVRLE